MALFTYGWKIQQIYTLISQKRAVYPLILKIHILGARMSRGCSWVYFQPWVNETIWVKRTRMDILQKTVTFFNFLA